jgi:CheY-like chemotaxis protein
MSGRRIKHLASGRLRRRAPRLAMVMVMVEDPVVRVAVSDLLREHGYAVREVGSLQDGIWRADLEPPDVILMDVPGDWAAARMAARSFRVLRVTHDTPLVALGPAAPPAETQGIDAVLPLPFTGRELLRLLDRQLERRRRWGGAA